MRRPVFLIFTNAMILLVIMALLAQSLVIIQRLAVAQSVVGRVEVQRGGHGGFKLLARSDAIKTGDVVRTGSDGNAEFKWADGTRWKIMPNTRILVKKSVSSMIKSGDQSQLELSSGKVFVRIVKALTPDSQFEVETPTAVAAVRGTIFSVEIKAGRTEVAVFKGSVKVREINGEASTMVEPGRSVRADDNALNTRSDAAAQEQFQAQPSIVTPELSAEVRSLGEGPKVLLSGETEAGDVVTVNGQAIRVLGNGQFRVPMNVPANGQFTIVSTDRHGVQSTLTRSAKAVAH